MASGYNLTDPASSIRIGLLNYNINALKILNFFQNHICFMVKPILVMTVGQAFSRFRQYSMPLPRRRLQIEAIRRTAHR
jgi:hypothetical protein